MGQVRTLYVKHLAKALVEKYPGRFTDKYEKNKEELNKLVKLESKKIRNEVAGYIVSVVKIRSRPKVEITYRPKEDRRRGRRRRRK